MAYSQIAGLRYISVTIAASGTTSAEVDTGGGVLVGITTPAALTSTAMTFTAANESGGTFNSLRDSSGNAISITVAASRSIAITSGFLHVAFLKVVMGSTEAAARELILIFG